MSKPDNCWSAGISEITTDEASLGKYVNVYVLLKNLTEERLSIIHCPALGSQINLVKNFCSLQYALDSHVGYIKSKS